MVNFLIFMAKDCTNVAITKTISTRVSSQCVTLESSLYYAATWLKLSLLDPSVSYLDDTILFPGSK
ncbi:hypothetical protein WD_1219 [Wolbachia endosymbiont of Drosophila melanogaster]|uniref:hypothetical protein n=2 Tax=Wolbachieae TaxID=952 RepID=UPI000023BC8C|nr:hypothetical protein WD_1219 [Wolbachia endosymbiont of Drosophila melanogaster]